MSTFTVEVVTKEGEDKGAIVVKGDKLYMKPFRFSEGTKKFGQILIDLGEDMQL